MLFILLGHVEKPSQKMAWNSYDPDYVGLSRINKAIEWKAFRPSLIESLDYKDPSKGGRRPWCPVLMLKILVLQKYYGLSDEQTELQIMDRLSFMKFPGLRLVDGVKVFT